MGGGPIRSCAGCRRRRPQPELVRIAARPGGEVAVDAGGRAPGRGVYVCPDRACVERAWTSRAFERALGYAGRIPEELHGELLSMTTRDER
jgi:predicted RNA-binding protein YlxR (DUF448 family)